MKKEFKLEGFPDWKNFIITEDGIINKDGRLITCEELSNYRLLEWKAAFYDRGSKRMYFQE